MKQLLLFVFAFSAMIQIHCQSPANGFITGQGEVVKEDITLAAITGIDLGFHGDVILTQGSPQKVTIEGQKNIIDNIKHDVSNGTWNIHFDKNVRDAKKVIVHITLPTLKEIGLSGSGNVTATNKFTGIDNIDITVAGSGNVTLDYEADVTDLSIAGSGKADLSGMSNTLSVEIAGSGDVNAKDLVTNECEVQISGSGDATVNASKSLEAHIAGSGNVQYAGSATVDSHIAGSGKVTKVN